VKLNPLSWFAPKAQAEEWSLSDDAVLQAFYGALSAATSSGVRVTQDSALRSTAVLACLIVRSETFAALPVDVLRRDGKAFARDEDSPAYRLLAVAPNELMTSKEFWRWKQLTEDIRGNAFARIVWKRGVPEAIWPLYGAKPQLKIDAASRRVAWQYAGDDFTPPDAYPLQDLLHFKGPVLTSPFEARSLIDLAAETIGVNIGSEQFFARLLGNGSHFPGYLETDNTLTQEDVDALRQQLAGFSGVLQAGTIRVFDRGLKYRQNPMSLKDAELTEPMRWQLQAICSVFRMPLAMVQDLSTGTYANSEQQDLWLGKHTMTPICVDSEAVLRVRLFARSPGSFARFNLDGLLRGDYKTRTEGDATLVRAGIISRDEARSHYDLNPVPGLEKYLAELNLGVVSDDGTVPGPDSGAARTEGEPPLAAPPAQENAPPEPAAAALLAPFVRDALEASRRRFERDRERGVPAEETVAFVAERLSPLAEAHAAAGLAFEPGALLAEAAGDASPTLEP
jgi:HK97 family phage portal protein